MTRSKLQPVHRIRKMLGRQMGVYHGRLNVGVAHELLNCREIDTTHHQMGSKRMAQRADFDKGRNVDLAGNLDQLCVEPVVGVSRVLHCTPPATGCCPGSVLRMDIQASSAMIPPETAEPAHFVTRTSSRAWQLLITEGISGNKAERQGFSNPRFRNLLSSSQLRRNCLYRTDLGTFIYFCLSLSGCVCFCHRWAQIRHKSYSCTSLVKRG